MLRSSCGEALERLRISQPACGAGAARIRDEGSVARVAVAGVRQLHPVEPAHQAAGLDQAGRAQPRLAIRKRGPKPMPPASLSGSASTMRGSGTSRCADGDAVAGLQDQPRQQRRIDGRTERAVALREQVGHRQRRRQRQLSRASDRCRRPPSSRPARAGRRRCAPCRAGRGGRETVPRERRKADLLGLRLALEQRRRTMSPPSIVRPSRARPSLRPPRPSRRRRWPSRRARCRR